MRAAGPLPVAVPATAEEAEDAAKRLYAMVPNARITDVLADVHRWTGFADAFTHLHTGMPVDDPRVVLTAALADATNLGQTRMADACAVASYRKLVWTAGWHYLWNAGGDLGPDGFRLLRGTEAEWLAAMAA